MTCFVLRNVSKFLNDPDEDLQEDDGDMVGEEEEDDVINGADRVSPQPTTYANHTTSWTAEIATLLFERPDQ